MTSLDPRPREAIVAVNYRCNARCRMCDIWRLKEDGSLAPDDYRRLPAGIDNVGITGGEPFMRRDIVELVRTVYEAAGGPQIIVSTNGYLTRRIIDAMRALRGIRPAIGVGVSLDGIGAEHDRMRGTRHAFERAMATITALREESVRNVRLSFTITPENVTELVPVYRLARRLGVEFSSTIAHNSDHYFHTDANRRADSLLIRQAYDVVNREELSSRSIKRWFRAYYNEALVQYSEHGKRLVACTAARDFFFLSPRGDVYPCLVIPKVLGNIMEAPFDELWTGAAARSIRAEIVGCERCWMMCSARTSLKRHPIPAGAWVSRQKLSPNRSKN